MPEIATVGNGILAKYAEFTRRIRPVFEENIIGVGSKPTLLCNHARKNIHEGRHPYEARRVYEAHTSRFEQNIVGVGSKPTLFCNHVRNGIRRVRHLCEARRVYEAQTSRGEKIS